MKKINLDDKLYYSENFDFEVIKNRRKKFESKRINWFLNTSPRLEYNFPKDSLPNKNEEQWIKYSSDIDSSSEFQKLLNNRHSSLLNTFNNKWSLEEVVKLINISIGPSNRSRYFKGKKIPLRNYPSGGALYSIKMYIIINNLENYESGVYFISPENSALIPCQTYQHVNFATLFPMSKYKLDKNSDTIENVSFALFMVIDYRDSFDKYGELSDRLGLIEAGHIGQNLQLTAEYLGKKSLPACGFFPEEVENILGIRENDKAYCIYSVIFG